MAFKAGTAAHVLLDGVAGALVNISAYADNLSFPQTVQQLEVSVFGTASKAFIPGLVGGSPIPISGPLDVALGTFVTGLIAAQSAGSSSWTLVYSPGGSVAGQLKQTVETYVADFTTSTAVGGRAEFSANLQQTGAITNTTW